jgi:type II secretory ATPase GspE/PulE/Tfp pilus assembly ATPase PilB-like protein
MQKRRHSNYDEIKEMAVKKGMNTLLQDGLLKVKNGETTVTEVMRCLHSVGF